MTTTVTKLKEKIEHKKMEMLVIAENKGMTSLETIYCSQELDKLIYNFQIAFLRKEQGEKIS